MANSLILDWYKTKATIRWLTFLSEDCPLKYIDKLVYSVLSRRPASKRLISRITKLDRAAVAASLTRLQAYSIVQEKKNVWLALEPNRAWLSWRKHSNNDKWQQNTNSTLVLRPTEDCPLTMRQVVLYSLLCADAGKGIKRKTINPLAKILGSSPTTISNNLKTLARYGGFKNKQVLQLPEQWFQDKPSSSGVHIPENNPLVKIMRTYNYDDKDICYILKLCKGVLPKDAIQQLESAQQKHKTNQGKGKFASVKTSATLAKRLLRDFIDKSKRDTASLMTKVLATDDTQIFWEKRVSRPLYLDKGTFEEIYGCDLVQQVIASYPPVEREELKPRRLDFEQRLRDCKYRQEIRAAV